MWGCCLEKNFLQKCLTNMGGVSNDNEVWQGAIAQLVERFNGIEEVSGSNPLSSIKKTYVR